MKNLCAVCGLPLEPGEFPCIYTTRSHGAYGQRSGFEPRFDIGLGEYVTGTGDINKICRENNLVPRDNPLTRGDLSARRDRIEQQKRARR